MSCRKSISGWVRYVPPLMAGALALSVSSKAAALPLLTLSGSARFLYGSTLGDPLVTPYGPGLGLRAGVTLPLSLYLGASFDYFFGDSKHATLSQDASRFEISTATTQVMGNVGYDVGFGPLTLRPSLGLGFSHRTVTTAGADNGDSNFVASPGAELLLGFGLLNASAEARYNKVFSGAGSDGDAVVFGVGLGVSL